MTMPAAGCKPRSGRRAANCSTPMLAYSSSATKPRMRSPASGPDSGDRVRGGKDRGKPCLHIERAAPVQPVSLDVAGERRDRHIGDAHGIGMPTQDKAGDAVALRTGQHGGDIHATWRDLVRPRPSTPTHVAMPRDAPRLPLLPPLPATRLGLTESIRTRSRNSPRRTRHCASTASSSLNRLLDTVDITLSCYIRPRMTAWHTNSANRCVESLLALIERSSATRAPRNIQLNRKKCVDDAADD